MIASRARLFALLAPALAVVALCVRPADAGPSIVIESHVGDRPDDAERYVAPVLLALAKRGYMVGPDGVGAAYESTVSRPGSSEDRATIYSFQGLVEEAWTAWYDARFDDAIKAGERAVEIYRRSPAAMIQGKSRRTQYFQSLVILAMSHAKKAEQDVADETMAELVRAFPGQAVPHDQFGPEAEKLYLKVAKQVAAEATGTLHVRVVGSATIYVDEATAGSGEVTQELPPGSYRVLVKQSDQEGRVYDAVIESGKTTEIEADADFDAALHTSPVFAGFVFVDERSQGRHEAGYAVRLAVARDADLAVVLRFGTEDGKRALVGTVLDEDGKVIRTRSLPLEPDPPVERLTELGAYLAGEAVPETDDADQDDEAVAGGSSGSGLRWMRWPMFAIGLAAIGTGAALLAVDGDCVRESVINRTCPTIWHTKTGGVALGVAGLALVSGAVWWQLRGGGSGEHRTAAALSIDRGGFGVLVRGSF